MMTFFEAVRWERVCDGLQLLLWGMILACLIHNKLKYRRMLPEAASQGRHPIFSQEVLLQTLRQQAEQALASVRAAVEAEQTKLQQLLEAAGEPSPPGESAAAGVAAENIPFCLGRVDPAGPVSLHGRFAGLQELAARGLTARQIAAQTKLPAGEIELALKLQRAGL
jgi:hypothetical protein